MAITLRRQLNDDEKQSILKLHGRKCFATGHLIPDSETVHFDHIRAFTSGGATELHNIAPMCETHNKAKGTLPLEDFRVRLRLQEFFSHGDAVTLKDLLAYMKKSGDVTGYGQTVVVNEDEGSHANHDGCLCIGCLELRLGRRLVPKDFPEHPFNRMPGTRRLMERRGEPEWYRHMRTHPLKGE